MASVGVRSSECIRYRTLPGPRPYKFTAVLDFDDGVCQTAETLSFALRKEAQASGAVKCGNEAVACDARNKMRDDNGRKATLGFDGAVAVKPGNDGRQLESDAVGLFRKWNLVVKQPWIDFPFSIQHTLLSCHDLDTATVHPRGKLTSQFQNRGGTCFPEECVSVARNGPVSRNMLTLCRQCLRKDAQLRLVGNIALAAAAIGNFDEALLLIEEAEVCEQHASAHGYSFL